MFKKNFFINTLLVTSVLCAQAYAANTDNLKAATTDNLKGAPTGCVGLEVNISNDILNQYRVANSPTMLHGSYYSCTKTFPSAKGCNLYILSQSGAYGPDAVFTFKNRKTGNIVKVETQQNFCALEAGGITVKPLIGKWKVGVKEGAFGTSNGQVWLNSVTP
ncbi:MAG: hypothetical protein LPH21_03020 [Shewanella sp.]|nr:hypothetical protein [Shewanella sp.]